MTDEAGDIVEAVDYYPYGSPRVDQKTGGYQGEARKYIGERYDAATNLSYLNARYYDGARGQFTSQDPVFWGKQDLANPQSLNSYGYSLNNPISRKDPSGKASISDGMKAIVSLLQSLVSSLMSWIKGGSGGGGGSSPSHAVKAPVPPQNPSTWDSVTNERIKGLDPRVRQPATDFINNVDRDLGVKLRITTGYRSPEEQDRLFEQGRTTPGDKVTYVRGGYSYHNYGLAMDVVRMTGDGQADWTPIDANIAAVAKQGGFEWGGEWAAPYTDYPHFEMTFGQSIQDLRR